MAYVTRWRMLVAHDRLRAGDTTVAAVAARDGLPLRGRVQPRLPPRRRQLAGLGPRRGPATRSSCSGRDALTRRPCPEDTVRRPSSPTPRDRVLRTRFVLLGTGPGATAGPRRWTVWIGRPRRRTRRTSSSRCSSTTSVPPCSGTATRWPGRLGLTPSEVLCLEVCRRHGSMSSGRLGERLGLTRSAVAKMLRRLEDAGHVVRLSAPDHEQEVEVRSAPARRPRRRPRRAASGDAALAARDGGEPGAARPEARGRGDGDRRARRPWSSRAPGRWPTRPSSGACSPSGAGPARRGTRCRGGPGDYTVDIGADGRDVHGGRAELVGGVEVDLGGDGPVVVALGVVEHLADVPGAARAR